MFFNIKNYPNIITYEDIQQDRDKKYNSIIHAMLFKKYQECSLKKFQSFINYNYNLAYGIGPYKHF